MAKAKAKAKAKEAKSSKKKKASGTKATQEINKAQASARAKTKAYKNGKEYKAASKLQNSTIDDIAKKYGFDFSKDYANRQAEVAAQAQRNVYNSQGRTNDATHKTTLQRLSDNYDSAAGDLDKGYFQQFLGQRQGQADRGLNAGIAANQNLQLAMNKQSEVADLWKQRNTNTQEEDLRYANQSQTISEALAQVEKEKYANAENLYQGLLSKGYDILSSDRASANQWADSAWNRTTFDINNDNTFSKMRVDDIYNEQRRADELAAEQRAAARARASRGPGGSRSPGGSPGGSYQKTVLTPSYNKYNDTVAKQKQTPLQKYYSQPSIVAGQRTGSPYLRNPLPPAQNPNLTAWDKKRMLGL